MRSRTRPDNPSSIRVPRRLAGAVPLAVGLSVLTWLPSPLPGRTLPGGIPPTEARAVSIRSSSLVASAPGRALHTAGQGVRADRDVVLRPMALCAPIRFTAVALTWVQQGSGSVGASIQGGRDLYHWDAPLDAGSAGDGPDRGSPDSLAGRTGTGLVWVGSAECARIFLRVPGGADLSDMRVVYINTEGTAHGAPSPPPRNSGPRALGITAAEAMTQQPAIITRAQWGANERYRNCGPYYSSRVKMAFVHHTANANGYRRSQSPAIMRAIY